MSKARIYYHDIGDYLSREEKLAIIGKFGSIDNIEWQELSPNEHGDWLNQRNDAFESFIPLAPEKKFDVRSKSVFMTYAIGLASNRDAWVYNFSKQEVELNMQQMIGFYNEQLKDYQSAKAINPNLQVEDFIDTDATKISWTVNLKKDIEKYVSIDFDGDVFESTYRPFCRQKIYFDNHFIERPGLSRKLFPYSGAENRVICISGVGASKDFSVLITDSIPNLDSIEKAQCFPMYHYEERKTDSMTLFDDTLNPEPNTQYIRRDAISDFILEHCRKAYGGRGAGDRVWGAGDRVQGAESHTLNPHTLNPKPYTLTKEDIFYYVYGILHSVEYRTTFAADLKKMLPRIPLTDEARDFWSFSKAGRALVELHLNYEGDGDRVSGMGVRVQGVGVQGAESHTLNPIPLTPSPQTPDPYTLYAVEKMRFPSKSDKSRIIYNSQISIDNIPLSAYDYVVNGKSAIEWIMERYAITTHKDSGITNDPNLWAIEHNNPRYILNLLLSVIRLSVESVEIINNLPKITL